MTQFAPVKDPSKEKDDATETANPVTFHTSPDGETPKATAPLAGQAVPKSAIVPGELEFEPTKLESWTSPWADVKDAKAEHARCLKLADTLSVKLGKLDIRPADLEAIQTSLGTINTELKQLVDKKVSTTDRAKVVAYVKGAAAAIAALETKADDAVKAKATEDEKLRLAEVDRLKKEQEAKLAEEAKVKKAAEDKKKEEDAAKAKEEEDRKRQELEKQAKADEDAKAQQKADDAKKAKEEKAAKAAADLAEKKRLEEEAAAAALAKEAEDARLAEEKRVAAEEAAEKRRVAFGDKTGAHAAAKSTAGDVAKGEYDAEIAKAKDVRAKSLESLSKATVTKGVHPKVVAANAVREEAESAAKEHQGERQAAVEQELVGVATSASGKLLGDKDLAWVIGQAKGNSAYGQVLADLAVASSVATATTIAKEPDASTIAPQCLALISGGLDAKLALRMVRILDKGNGPFKAWLRSVAANDLDDALDFAELHSGALPFVAVVHPVLGSDADADEFIKGMVGAKAKLDDVTWLLSLNGTPNFIDLVRVVKRYPLNPAKVRAIHTAAGAAFDLQDVARICDDNHKRLDAIPAMLPNADPHSVTFVRLWFEVGGGAEPSALLLHALRAEALLTDAAKCGAFTVTVQQADRPYGRTGAHAAECIANDTRTGFLYMNFPHGRAQQRVHTHWNAASSAVGKISSMHVQLGAANGLELNQWYSFFPLLVQAAIAAHNAGAAAPTGGPLSM